MSDQRRCRVQGCRRRFTPEKEDQLVCSIKCAQVYGPGLRHRMRKAAMKTKKQHLDELQVIFNRYIRLRDQHHPCVSCGRWHKGKWNAGHFLSRGSHPELRFSEDNVHRQCEPCNSHLSGNAIPYREELIRRIGEDRVLALEGPHEPAKWTEQELEELKEKYQRKIKEIIEYFPDSDSF